MGLNEILTVGIVTGVVGLLMSLASRNRERNNNLYRRDCCINCKAEHSRRASRSSNSLPLQEEQEHDEVDASIVLHPCNHQAVMTVNAPPGFQLSLDFLPCFLGRPATEEEDRFGTGWILGSSNGLLLCSTHKYNARQGGPTQYYLCEPCSKQWIALPPTPKSLRVEHCRGFVFDPCTNFGNPDLHQPLPCSEGCRFMIFIYSLFEVDIFSSDVGQWSRASLPCPRELPDEVGSLFHNGCLHWLARGNCVVYDPYNNKLRGLIPLPPNLQLCKVRPLQGPMLSRGSIWLLQHSYSSGFIRCWELKGYDLDTNGQFDLDKCYWSAHRLCNLTEILGDSASCEKVLAIHPHNPDIVYLKLTRQYKYEHYCDYQICIVSCNLRTKVLGQPMLEYDRFKKQQHHNEIILVHQPQFKSSFSPPSSLTTSPPLI